MMNLLDTLFDRLSNVLPTTRLLPSKHSFDLYQGGILHDRESVSGMNCDDGRENFIFKPVFPRADSVRRAFPLVQLFHPNLDFDAWVAYTRFFTRMSRQRGGLVVFEDARGYVHALFAYRLTYHLRHREVLHVSDILMGHLPGQTLARAVIVEATKIGKDRGCSSILLEFAEEGVAPPRDALADMGFRPVAAHLHIGPWLAS